MTTTNKQAAALQALADQAQELDMGYGQPDSSATSDEAIAFPLALNVKHADCHKAADAFWNYWNENGETHKRGYYESTWGAINRAIRMIGIVPWTYGQAPQAATPLPEQDERALPVGWRDKLRWSKANTDYHGYVAFTPKQLEHFVSMLTLQAAPVAPTLTVPHEMGYPEKVGDVGTAYTNGWNDCRLTMLGEIADDSTNSPAVAAPEAPASAGQTFYKAKLRQHTCGQAGEYDARVITCTGCYDKDHAALEAPASEQQTDQAHVLPPFAAPAGQHEASFAVLSAVRDGVPLQEPVNITKAVLAQREARVVLSGGKGPEACVMLVNIQITGWAEGSEKAEAFASGYNTAFKWYRGALLDLANKVSADAASRFRAQGGNTNDDSGDSTAATTASASGERAAGYLTGENFKRLALGQVAEILPVESGSDGKTAVYFRAPAPSRKAAPQPTRAQVNDWMCDVGWQNSAIRQADLARVERVVGLALAQQGAAQAAPASEKGEGNV